MSAVLRVLLALAVLGGGVAYLVHQQREIGRREVLLAQSANELRVAKARADSLERAYRVDTVRLTRLKVVTDTMTTTVERWKHDTLEVVRYVVQADSTIKACTQALATCDQMVGAERKGREAAEAQVAILRQRMPSKLAPWRHGAMGVAVGALAVFVLR
jgi:hypothetical protein